MDAVQSDEDLYYTPRTYTTEVASDSDPPSDSDKKYRMSEVSAYSSSSFVDERCTLRRMNRRYAQLEGCAAVSTQPEEFAKCVAKDCVAPLRRFNNTVGHFHDGITVSFKPVVHSSYREAITMACMALSETVESGLMWDLSGVRIVSHSKTAVWQYDGSPISEVPSSILSKVLRCATSPLSAHSWYASTEASRREHGHHVRLMFLDPQETTRMTGLLGTFSNNQSIDMTPDGEESGVPNAAARTPKPEESGIICAGHTAHSTEALKVRKVTDGVVVRVLGQDTLHSLMHVVRSPHNTPTGMWGESDGWVFYMMGFMAFMTINDVHSLWRHWMEQTCDIDARYTLHVYAKHRVVVVSVSSGVLLKRLTNGYVVDSCMLHMCQYPPGITPPHLTAKDTPQSMREYFSTFFMMVPYVRYDRPPRTVMASMQAIQGVCHPWAAGSSAYAPMYSEMPLVITDFTAEMFSTVYGTYSAAHLGHVISPSDVLPGRTLLTVLANLTYTYEDSAIVNEAAVQRGMFVCTVQSVYSIDASERIPEVNTKVTSEAFRWWKSQTPLSTVRSLSASQLDSYGIVTSVGVPFAGKVSVGVRSTSLLQTGDKIATWNGQKYTAYITPQEDMPWVLDERGASYTPDIVISVTSMVKRQTNGAAMGLMNAKTAARHGTVVVQSDSSFDDMKLECESELYDGKTGEVIMRPVQYTTDAGLNTEVQVPVMCTWGFTHFVEQTQKSRDKQHYSHSTVGTGSIKPRKGRSAGGAVNLDEMSMYAMTASGLSGIVDELRARSDVVVTDVCDACHLISVVCTCETATTFTEAALPLNFIVTQVTSVIYHNTAVELYF
jgi:hypothetical protein